MTSMRIDGNKSVKVWGDRLIKAFNAAIRDGVVFEFDEIAEELQVFKGDDGCVILAHREEE